MRRIERRTWIPAGLLAAAGVLVLVGVSCRVATSSATWDERRGPVVSHRTFPGDCGICHQAGNWTAVRRDFSFNHEDETGHRLTGAHAEAACLRCHNDRGPVTAYAALGCGGCHPDRHATALGTDCESCHSQTDWKPRGEVARDVQTHFHLIPAHSIPPCEGCHARPTDGLSKVLLLSTQCEPCHGNGTDRPAAP